MNIMQMFSNPQAYAMQMLNQNPQIKNNPVVQNALQMAQSGNQTELQKIANNLAKANGVDLNTFMRQFGMK